MASVPSQEIDPPFSARSQGGHMKDQWAVSLVGREVCSDRRAACDPVEQRPKPVGLLVRKRFDPIGLSAGAMEPGSQQLGILVSPGVDPPLCTA
jgi:hypothetical protein